MNYRRRGGLGNYPDPFFPYVEDQGVYNPPPGTPGVPQAPAPVAAVPPGYVNNIHFFQTTFNGVQGSDQVLQTNYQRVYLLIQNNDPAAICYVGFGNNPNTLSLQVAPNGGSYTIDQKCPFDSVWLFSTVQVTGGFVVIEGTVTTPNGPAAATPFSLT